MSEDSIQQRSEFCSPDFDANLYASKMVCANQVSEALLMVNEKIRNLDTGIYQHVTKHHQDLLKKATEIDNLHHVLQLTEEKINNLSISMDKVKRKVQIPHQVLNEHITRFRHLQKTTELLRKISRIALLVKRVQARSSDLSKLSGYVNEMEYLFSSMDWKGIHVLESYKRAMDQSREDMISQAWGLVNSSYELADQAQLGLGLQVFENFGMLSEVVGELINKWQTEFEEALADAIDVEKLTQRVRSRQPKTSTTGPGRASLTAVGGQAAAFHVAMWTSLDNTVDRLERFLLHCRLLGLTLLKQRDTTTGAVLTNPICRIGESIDPHPSLAELLLDKLVQTRQDAENRNLRTAVILLFASVHVTNEHLRIDPDFTELLTQPDSSLTSQRAVKNLLELRSDLGESEGFLGWASNLLAEQLSKAASQSPQIKEPLDGEYPKLLKLILDLERRLRQTQAFWDSSTNSGLSDSTSEIPQRVEQQQQQQQQLPVCMLRALSSFETAYLSRSLSRLFDRVAMAFSASSSNTSSAPDMTEVDGIVQNAVNELAYATVHYELLCKVSKNVAKMVALFATKVEGLIAVGATAEQCIDAQTPGQQNNIRLVNLLCAFGTQLEVTCNRRLRNLPVLQSAPTHAAQSPFAVIQGALTTRLNSLCLSILDPFLHSVDEMFGEILGTMHGESFDDTKPRSNGSQYMKNLQDFVSRIRRQYLFGLTRSLSSKIGGNAPLQTDSRLSGLSESCFPCGEAALQEAIRPYLGRWIDAFLVHISLVRPLSEAGQMQLTTDCTEFELALAPLTMPSMGFSLATLVPKHYAKLRAFRPILTTATEQIVEVFTKSQDSADSVKLDTSLSPSLVCQHLFSRAPAEIRSPHDAAGWSTVRYVAWIQSGRSEKERLAFLRNGLTVYTREVEMRQQREYAAIYLHLRAFLQHYQEYPDKTDSKPRPVVES